MYVANVPSKGRDSANKSIGSEVKGNGKKKKKAEVSKVIGTEENSKFKLNVISSALTSVNGVGTDNKEKGKQNLKSATAEQNPKTGLNVKATTITEKGHEEEEERLIVSRTDKPAPPASGSQSQVGVMRSASTLIFDGSGAQAKEEYKKISNKVNYTNEYKLYLYNTNKYLFFKEYFKKGRRIAIFKARIRKQLIDYLVENFIKELNSNMALWIPSQISLLQFSTGAQHIKPQGSGKGVKGLSAYNNSPTQAELTLLSSRDGLTHRGRDSKDSKATQLSSNGNLNKARLADELYLRSISTKNLKSSTLHSSLPSYNHKNKLGNALASRQARRLVKDSTQLISTQKGEVSGLRTRHSTKTIKNSPHSPARVPLGMGLAQGKGGRKRGRRHTNEKVFILYNSNHYVHNNHLSDQLIHFSANSPSPYKNNKHSSVLPALGRYSKALKKDLVRSPMSLKRTEGQAESLPTYFISRDLRLLANAAHNSKLLPGALIKFYKNKSLTAIKNNIFWGPLDGTVTLPLIVKTHIILRKKSLFFKKETLIKNKKILKLAISDPLRYNLISPVFKKRKPVFFVFNKPNFLPLRSPIVSNSSSNTISQPRLQLREREKIKTAPCAVESLKSKDSELGLPVFSLSNPYKKYLYPPFSVKMRSANTAQKNAQSDPSLAPLPGEAKKKKNRIYIWKNIYLLNH